MMFCHKRVSRKFFIFSYFRGMGVGCQISEKDQLAQLSDSVTKTPSFKDLVRTEYPGYIGVK